MDLAVAVPVRAELDILTSAMSHGLLTDAELGMLVMRLARRLGHACWCDTEVCCGRHQRHMSPHANCALG